MQHKLLLENNVAFKKVKKFGVSNFHALQTIIWAVMRDTLDKAS